VKHFLSADSEPLRRWLYGTLMAGLGVALVTGYVTDELVSAVGVFLGAALLLVPATEVARSKVTPANADTQPVDETNLS
jgi:hypothetical protein